MSSTTEPVGDILIVDDLIGTVRDVLAHFRRHRWRYLHVTSLSEAKTAIQGHDFGLLVLDWRLPGTDSEEGGAELVRCLKTAAWGPRNQAIPFVVLSAQYDSIREDMVSGYPGYLGIVPKVGRQIDRQLIPVIDAVRRRRARTAWRSMVRIMEIMKPKADKAGEVMLRAVVPAWKPNDDVIFPLRILPDDLQADVQKTKLPLRLFANADLRAETSDDLRLEWFTRAPEADPNDGLA